MAVAATVVALLVAALEVIAEEWIDSGALMLTASSLFVLGLVGGWRGVVFFVVAYLGIATVQTVFFWTGDPLAYGFDDSGPYATTVLMLPFTLPFVGFGALVRWAIRELLPQRWSIGT